jgi:hypothetical protein
MTSDLSVGTTPKAPSPVRDERAPTCFEVGKEERIGLGVESDSLSSLPGLFLLSLQDPPINRQAIFFRPMGLKTDSCLGPLV